MVMVMSGDGVNDVNESPVLGLRRELGAEAPSGERVINAYTTGDQERPVSVSLVSLDSSWPGPMSRDWTVTVTVCLVVLWTRTGSRSVTISRSTATPLLGWLQTTSRTSSWTGCLPAR